MRYLLILLVFSSCSTMSEAYLAKKGRLPVICAERFPIQTDTIIQKDTILKTDTFLSGEYIFDTLKVNDTLIKIHYKPLIVKQVKKLTKIVKVEDKAKIEALNGSVKRLEAQNLLLLAESNKYKGLAKSRLNWIILLCAVILGYSIRKPLMAIIKWNLRIS